MKKIIFFLLTGCFLGPVFADKSESFIIKSLDPTNISFYKGTLNTIGYTYHHIYSVCQGRSDGYILHSPVMKVGGTGSVIEFEIPVWGPYDGDKRESCEGYVKPTAKNPDGNLITEAYWIFNFNYLYYVKQRTMHGCKLYNEISNQTVTKEGKKPYNIAALSMTYSSGDAGFAHKHAFIIGMNTGEDASQLQPESGYFLCDPREKVLTGFDPKNPRYTTYVISLDTNPEMNQSASGIELVTPGTAKYPVYQFQVQNKTNKTITLNPGTSIEQPINSSYYAYCQNPTGWDTVNYVFQDAMGYILAIQGDSDDSIKDVIESVKDMGKGLKPILEAKCADALPPVFVPLLSEGDNTQPIAPGKTLTIGNGYTELENFDNFLDVSVSFNDGEKDYQYALAPADKYAPLTFNSGYHVVKAVISPADGGGYQVDLYSEPNIGVSIHNELHLMKNDDVAKTAKQDSNSAVEVHPKK